MTETTKKTAIALGGGLAVAAVLAAAVLLSGDAGPSEGVARTDAGFVPAELDELTRRDPSDGLRPDRGERPARYADAGQVADGPTTGDGGGDADGGATRAASRTPRLEIEIPDQPRPLEPVPGLDYVEGDLELDEPPPEEPTDAGYSDVDPNRDWRDPTNRRVLGDRRWMADTPDAESARIRKEFEKPKPIDPHLSDADRRRSIEAVRGVVDACVAELREYYPGREGRIILVWDSWATEGIGRVDRPFIRTNVGFRDPAFVDCVIENAAAVRFMTAADGESITIEYPFFYDGN